MFRQGGGDGGGGRVLVLYMSLCLVLSRSSSFTHCCVVNVNTSASDSLDVLLQRSAFEALARLRPHTGALYGATATLPANFSGMGVSVVRLRSRSLRSRGANFSAFAIPQGTRPVPSTKRIAIVYEDLGNWSSHYYTLPGYILNASVIGFAAYDASDLSGRGAVSRVRLDTTGKPISIRFPGSAALMTTIDEMRKCVVFEAEGKARLTEMASPNVCHSGGGGSGARFSVVVPSYTEGKTKSNGKRRVIEFLVWCLGGLAVVCISGFVIVRHRMRRKIIEMQKRAEEGINLGRMSVGGSRMPSAMATRTRPVLETSHVL